MHHRPEVILTLNLQDGDEPRGRRQLSAETIRLGSGHSCELRFRDTEVARMHAVIELAGAERCDLVDLGHGTRVNGQEVDRCRLHAGDRIEIGSSRIEVVAIERSSRAVAATENESNRTSNPFLIPALGAFEAADQVAADAPEGSYQYRLLASAPEVPADLCETARDAMTVEVWWGQNLLHVAHLKAGASYHLGEIEDGPQRCDYFVPASKLGAPRVPVVLAGRAVVPPSATGRLSLPDAPEMDLAEAQERGLLVPSRELAGAKEIALGLGAKLTIELDDLRLELRAEREGKRAAAGWTAGALMGGAAAWVLASFVGHAGLLAAVAALVPSLGATGDDGMSEDQRYWVQQQIESAADREQEQRETELLDDQADGDEGGQGTRAKDEEGSMGSPQSNNSDGRWAMRGPAAPEEQQIGRSRVLDEAQRFGVIGLIHSNPAFSNGPTAPWGALESVGSGDIDAEGNMWGSQLGDAYGAGGLGLSGIGEGGGGNGEGIGLGHIGTVGGGSGGGLGEGFGRGNGGIGRRGGHTTRPPRVRIADTQVSGRLPAETIQRVVRMSHGRFRACYEGGLRTNPNLRGRVAVRFIIARDGTVSNASGGGDLPDSGVVSCITRAFYSLTFPPPEGGIVTVSYPILVEPSQ